MSEKTWTSPYPYPHVEPCWVCGCEDYESIQPAGMMVTAWCPSCGVKWLAQDEQAAHAARNRECAEKRPKPWHLDIYRWIEEIHSVLPDLARESDLDDIPRRTDKSSFVTALLTAYGADTQGIDPDHQE